MQRDVMAALEQRQRFTVGCVLIDKRKQKNTNETNVCLFVCCLVLLAFCCRKIINQFFFVIIFLFVASGREEEALARCCVVVAYLSFGATLRALAAAAALNSMRWSPLSSRR